ncbi:cytochrome C oxidase subunit IV family protein [Halobacillus halophilus]|uniref:cytochrome C oxidase subunit IV family protein n=1 Tax=Halobacillus halophilus TaxID=1570 RepID=UPI001CD38902|nr:cytochrome C oxidase subunit IV family protein [Halobacillus halophilus]MCA1009851.1 cytochrome C oxidase subunit IV family protein [Halobacillus halophilus]
MTDHKKRIPTQHIIGFFLSITLTLVAAWAALQSDLSVRWIIIGIMALAIIQAGIQLFMFMHVVEPESQGGHIPWNMMFHGGVLATILVAGSLFTMSFGFSHDHDGDGHNQQEQQEEHSEMEDSTEHSGH